MEGVRTGNSSKKADPLFSLSQAWAQLSACFSLRKAFPRHMVIRPGAHMLMQSDSVISFSNAFN